MKMTTYNSYSVFRSDVYSDGYSTGRPHFTPDLAKCPSCKILFFRHNIKDKIKMKFREAGTIKDIKDPNRSDLINALKTNVAKTWEEELQLLEDLWRDFNGDLRYGSINLSDNEIEYWTAICAALLPLAEKKYNEKNDDNYLIQIAELYRNILNFDKCIEIINSLDPGWDWLKDQYILECERKNPCPFVLLTKSDLNLENNERADKYDYLDRARKYTNRRLFEKALGDYNKAEELGHNDYYTLYIERSQIYSQIFNDHDKAITDYSKALSIAQTSLQEEKERNKPLNIDCYTDRILNALFKRCCEYELIREFENAFADINAVIKLQYEYLAYKEYESIKNVYWKN